MLPVVAGIDPCASHPVLETPQPCPTPFVRSDVHVSDLQVDELYGVHWEVSMVT